jgi:hypothetical protein
MEESIKPSWWRFFENLVGEKVLQSLVGKRFQKLDETPQGSMK